MVSYSSRQGSYNIRYRFYRLTRILSGSSKDFVYQIIYHLQKQRTQVAQTLLATLSHLDNPIL